MTDELKKAEQAAHAYDGLGTAMTPEQVSSDPVQPTRDLEAAALAKWLEGEAVHQERIAARYKAASTSRQTYSRRAEMLRASAAYLAARSAPEAGKAVDDIVAERQRQINAEGWTPEHDDEHDKGEMARAAACYAYEATRTEHQRSLDDGFAPPMWPWAERWWKPTDRRRDLVKAAALIIAEIERLDRAAKG